MEWWDFDTHCRSWASENAICCSLCTGVGIVVTFREKPGCLAPYGVHEGFNALSIHRDARCHAQMKMSR